MKTKKEIPHFVQILKKDIPSDAVKSKLISCYNDGGSEVDSEMLKRNPNAKKKIMFVSSSSPIATEPDKYRIHGDEESGHWLYCGDYWYVRKIEKKFEFAQYKIYNTKTKATEGLWDEEKYN